MTRPVGLSARAAVFVAVTTALVMAQPAGQAARPAANPDGVLVYVQVERPDGTSATGLTRDDFEILVDGHPQAIASLSSDAGATSVVLLLDETTSMRMGDLASGIVIQRAVDQWFPFGLKAGDRARVGTIAKHLFLSEKFTADRHELALAAATARNPAAADKAGPSPIWDAVDGAVGALEWEGGQRAVLVFTDGRSTGNRLSLAEAGVHASRTGTSVHIVAEHDTPVPIVQTDGSEVVVAPDAGLRWLADRTGGTYRSDRPFPWSDPGPIIGKLLDALHHAYALGFTPARDGQVHALEVKSKTPGLIVRARKSFVAGYGTPPLPGATR